jgi:hypothetical protein
MNSVQCFDGLGSPVDFQWYSISRDFREYLDRLKNHNSYVGRAAKSVVDALDTAEPLKGKDITQTPGLFSDALVRIRIGLEPLKLALSDYPKGVEYDHLFAMRDHVDACLDLLGVDPNRSLTEAREVTLRPDALDGLVAKTASCRESVQRTYSYAGSKWDGMLLVYLFDVNITHHSDLSSITKPHRLKTFMVNTAKQKILIQKPTLYFVWGGKDRTTLCLGHVAAVKNSSGKSFQAMRVRHEKFNSQEHENFKKGMTLAEEALMRFDALELVQHRHG